MLAKGLSSLSGLSVALIVPDIQQDAFARRLATDGASAIRVTLHTVPSYRVRDPRAYKLSTALCRSLNDIGTDVLHYQLGGDPWSAIAVRSASKHLPLVTTVHEIRPRIRDEDQWWSVLSRRIAIGCSRYVIGLTDSTKLALERRYADRLPNTVVIPLGETGSWYRGSHTPPSIDRPMASTVLFFGRIRPYKGLDLLLSAAERVASECPDFRLVVAGSGATADDLFPAGKPDWADLRLGHIPDNEVAGLFDEARAAVLPYRQASQSGVTSTAFGLGCPVLVADVGGLADGVVDGANGLIVPPDDLAALTDALRRIVVDDRLAATLRHGAEAHRAMSATERQRIAERTASIYARAAQT